MLAVVVLDMVNVILKKIMRPRFSYIGIGIYGGGWGTQNFY